MDGSKTTPHIDAHAAADAHLEPASKEPTFSDGPRWADAKHLRPCVIGHEAVTNPPGLGPHTTDNSVRMQGRRQRWRQPEAIIGEWVQQIRFCMYECDMRATTHSVAHPWSPIVKWRFAAAVGDSAPATVVDKCQALQNVIELLVADIVTP